MDRDPGGLQSKGSQKVGQDLVTNTFTFKVYLMSLIIQEELLMKLY